MFYGCISLKYIPTLPATNLVDGCYKTMFCDCSSLELSWKYSSERPYLYKIPTVGEGIGFPGATEAMVARIGFLEEPISHYDLNLGLFINTPYYINYPPV